MKKIRRFLFLLLIFILSMHLHETVVLAKDISDYVQNDNDYQDIQRVIDDATVANDSFQFGEYVSDIITNKRPLSFKSIMGGIVEGILDEVRGNISVIGKLIAIAIVAAIFTNFASVFMDNQIAETGFYITYIVLFTIILTSFQKTSTLAVATVNHVLEFVKVLIPTYFMSVTVASGATSSIVFYEFTLVTISIVNIILLRILIPAVNVYLIILLADNLTKEDKLSKLAKTLATAIKWALRSLVVLVIGFNAVQSLVAPVADGVKRSVFTKLGGAIPGVGNLLSGVTETVLGASVLLKNAIGVAGLVAIIIICTLPIIKLVIYYFIYRLCESVVQPISDKRILKYIGACADAVSMILQIVIVGAVLFIISITIVTASTSMIR